MLDPIFCGFFEKYQFYIGANNEHFGPGNWSLERFSNNAVVHPEILNLFNWDYSNKCLEITYPEISDSKSESITVLPVFFPCGIASKFWCEQIEAIIKLNKINWLFK
jgi:hypothetical protein